MTTRELNRAPKVMDCNVCGLPFMGDRCHHTCPRCAHKRDAAVTPAAPRGRARLMSPMRPTAKTFNFAGNE